MKGIEKLARADGSIITRLAFADSLGSGCHAAALSAVVVVVGVVVGDLVAGWEQGIPGLGLVHGPVR